MLLLTCKQKQRIKKIVDRKRACAIHACFARPRGKPVEFHQPLRYHTLLIDLSFSFSGHLSQLAAALLALAAGTEVVVGSTIKNAPYGVRNKSHLRRRGESWVVGYFPISSLICLLSFLGTICGMSGLRMLALNLVCVDVFVCPSISVFSFQPSQHHTVSAASFYSGVACTSHTLRSSLVLEQG